MPLTAVMGMLVVATATAAQTEFSLIRYEIEPDRAGGFSIAFGGAVRERYESTTSRRM